MSSSALINCETALAASFNFRIGASSALGISSSLPCAARLPFTSSPYSDMASSKLSAALVSASDALPGRYFRAMAAAR